MTTTINLLPWRAQKREQEKKEFHLLLSLVALSSLLLIGLFHLFFSRICDKQMILNEKIRKEISYLEKDIKTIQSLEDEKRQLIEKISVIQSLQKNRPEIVHLFNDIVLILPPGTHFESLDRQGSNVFMKGYSSSNSQVSQLMRNMKSDSGFLNPVLSNIRVETINQVRMIAFDLSSVYSTSKQEEDSNEAK